MDPTLLAVLMLALGAIVGGILGSWITRLLEKSRTAQVEARGVADAEKIDWIKNSQQTLRETFEALAARSLRGPAHALRV